MTHLQLPTDVYHNISTTYLSSIYHLSTSCFYHVSTNVSTKHIYHMSTIYLSHIYHISTICLSHIYRISTIYPSDIYHISTIKYHISIAYPSYIFHIPMTYSTDFYHIKLPCFIPMFAAGPSHQLKQQLLQATEGCWPQELRRLAMAGRAAANPWESVGDHNKGMGMVGGEDRFYIILYDFWMDMDGLQ